MIHFLANSNERSYLLHRNSSVRVEVYHPVIVIPGNRTNINRLSCYPSSPEDVVRLGCGQSENTDKLKSRAAVENFVFRSNDLGIRSWNVVCQGLSFLSELSAVFVKGQVCNLLISSNQQSVWGQKRGSGHSDWWCYKCTQTQNLSLFWPQKMVSTHRQLSGWQRWTGAGGWWPGTRTGPRPPSPHSGSSDSSSETIIRSADTSHRRVPSLPRLETDNKNQ